MQVFVAVVETGGITAGARSLGLAPSSVSRRISELEDKLAVTLLRRTTRRLSLTEAGTIYYERARVIVQSVDEVTLAVTETRAAPSGLLRLSVPAGIAASHVVPAVAAFCERQPGVRVAMTVTDRVVDLVEEELDVALRFGHLQDSSLIARKLSEAPRSVCAASAYAEAAGLPKDPSGLRDHACLMFRAQPGSNLWRFSKDGQNAEMRVTGPLLADDAKALVAAACAGMGLVLLPEWLTGAALDEGRLVRVLSGWTPEPATTPLYAVHASGPYVAPKIRSFLDFLVERFARG